MTYEASQRILVYDIFQWRRIWLIESRLGSPKLEWSSLQPMLKRAECDVLILLDCCFASSAVRGEPKGINEIIAACGRESETVPKGDKTFTKNLIRKMKSFGDQPFAAVEIYKRMIKDRKRLLASPHYHNLSGHKKPSVILVPRKLLPFSADLLAPLADSTTSTSGVSSDSGEMSHSRITEALDGPRVLLAVSLTADAKAPELEGWIQWLTSGAPPEIRNLGVKYESIYHGHSTLLLVSMPVTTWTCLPSSSGFRFLDIVTSDNLIPQVLADKGKSDTVMDQQDNAKSIKAGSIKSPTGIQTQMLQKGVGISGAETFGNIPPRRIKRDLQHSLKGQSGTFQAAFSPHGKKIASASGNDYALYWASEAGNDKEVQMLLEKGADVNTSDELHGSALQAASYRGHVNVVRMLLEKGADVNASGGGHGSALQAALYEGHVNVVHLLLDA